MSTDVTTTGGRSISTSASVWIPVVLAKPTAEQGKYLHPELHGKPSSLSVVPKGIASALKQAGR